MPNFTINVDGTNYTVGYDGTFNSPQGLLPALNNLGFGIFWIEEIGGNYVLTTVDNDNVFGDAETNPDPTTTSTTTTTTTSAPIPTTTSTTTTTTAAPTTSTTTTTTTAVGTSTTTTTTTIITTSTTTTTTTAITTSTTTTTTTAIATLYVDLNGANACSGIGTALPTYAYSGGTTLCDCTSLNAANATSLSAGTYFVSDGVNRRQFTSTGGGSPTLTAAGTCSACPIVTTSTTTTTTTLPPFTANIATTDAYDACNAPELSNIVFYGNGLNACDSTSVTFDSTLAGYLSSGQTFYISDRVGGIFYSNEWTRVGTTSTAIRNTTCVECVPPSTTTTTTSTTTTTTTAAPTFVWNTNSAAVSAQAACSATKDVYVWTFGNAWGEGIVFYAGTAGAPSQPIQPYLGGGFFYENGGQVITIDDNGVSSNLQPCPTTTSTTTTTTTAAFDYYFADEVDCFNSCSSISADVLVKFVGGSIVTLNKYYKNTANNRVYLLNSTATEGTAEELNPLLYNDCGSACSGITTTTTTTTAAPTTTTSTTTTTTTAAPTTTSTTTTTTTLAGVSFGVSLNTKYGTDFLACTGTVTGVVYQKAEFGNTPTVGAQLYTSSTTGAGTEWTPSQGIGLYLMQFGGSTKWSVLVGSTGVVNTVTSCAGVSTTTTTTTLPPITVSATPSCDGSGFSGQGRVTASSFSGGSGSYTLAAIGTSESNAIACINNAGCAQRVSIVGLTSYAWTSLANGPYYVAIRDTAGGLGLSSVATVSCNATTTTTTTSSTTTTTTPPPTTTSTTSTTTTAAPTFVWNTNSAAVSAQAACSATKDVYVWTFGNAWGTGIVFYAGTAGAPSQPIQPYLGGGFFYENGGQVINIDDNGVSSNLQPCPTTTTTTPAPTYSQYLDCVNNPYYTYNTNVGNGTSSEVVDNCVFYQGETSSPTGTFFTDFTAGGGCICP